MAKPIRVKFQFDDRSYMTIADLKRRGFEFKEIVINGKVLLLPIFKGKDSRKC